MGRRLKCTDQKADYSQYIYYLKGKGRKKSLYRSRRRSRRSKKLLVKDVVDNSPGKLFYAKKGRQGKLCIYNISPGKRRSTRRSRRRSRRKR